MKSTHSRIKAIKKKRRVIFKTKNFVKFHCCNCFVFFSNHSNNSSASFSNFESLLIFLLAIVIFCCQIFIIEQMINQTFVNISNFDIMTINLNRFMIKFVKFMIASKIVKTLHFIDCNVIEFMKKVEKQHKKYEIFEKKQIQKNVQILRKNH